MVIKAENWDITGNTIMKKIIDISWPIKNGSTEYKDRNSISIEQIRTIEKHGMSEYILHFHAHTGTHIDMPAHFLSNSATTTDTNLSALVNAPAIVLDLSFCNAVITKNDLLPRDSFIKADLFVLLKTKNSSLADDAPFDSNFVYVTADAAEYFASKKIRGVGIDYLGIERNQPGHPTHKTLLGNNIIIIEGLRLAHVQEGVYTMICLPVAIQDIDAVPARAVLIQR